MSKKIKLLRKIALEKRKDRVNAEIFDKNEISFQLDEKNYPISIGVKTRLDSEKLVEECMIMANYEVAKCLVKNFGENSLLIYHPKPTSCNIEHLNDMASDYGFRFKADSIQNLER
jgi:exoribonuclease R